MLSVGGAPLAFEMYGLLAAPTTRDTPLDMWQVLLFTVGVLAALAGIVLTLWQQYEYQARIAEIDERRSQNVTRFTDELGSTLDVLVDYSRSDGQREASESLIKDVLREGRRLYAHPGVRLCVYMIESTVVENQSDAQQYLVLREYDGRRDAPRAEFADGAHARCLLDIALGNRSVAVPDPNNPPEGIVVDHTDHSGWKSYLAVPLIRGRDHLGVLLIDTRGTTEFGDEDKSIGWTISRLLVHGLQATERQALEVRPEATEVLARLEGANRASLPKMSVVDVTMAEGGSDDRGAEATADD